MNVETKVNDNVSKNINWKYAFWLLREKTYSYNKLVKLPPKFDQIKKKIELSDKIDLVDLFPQSLITFYSI